MTEPGVADVTLQLADVIVKHKYVTFHHTQTTRRDFGGFHGHW